MSLARDAASAPPASASTWLESKLCMKDEEFYEYSDAVFETTVLAGKEEDIASGRAVGLVVFEAPLKGADANRAR